MKVLIIEDDTSILEMVRWVLDDEGYEVATAANGFKGLEVVVNFKPSLIILDMCMPVMNGWEFSRRYNGPAPVVVLTAASDAARIAADVGADGYLSKPFNLDDLLHVLELVCSAETAR